MIKESSVDKNKFNHKAEKFKREKDKTILNFPMTRGPGNGVNSF